VAYSLVLRLFFGCSSVVGREVESSLDCWQSSENDGSDQAAVEVIVGIRQLGSATTERSAVSP
jgi:hypothetical protein